jgi:hypothetical protein
VRRPLALLVALLLAAVAAGTAAAQPAAPSAPDAGLGPFSDGRTAVVGFPGVRSRVVAFTIERRGDGLQVRSGRGGPVVMTMQAGRIFDGRSALLTTAIYTVRGPFLIPGFDSNVTHARCAIRGSRVFNGLGSTLADVRYTFKHVGDVSLLYRGASTGPLTNVLYTLDGQLDRDTTALVVAIAGC